MPVMKGYMRGMYEYKLTYCATSNRLRENL